MEAMAAAITAALEDRADPLAAGPMAAYMKVAENGTLPFLGVRRPEVRRTARTLARGEHPDVLLATVTAARAFRFEKADEITIVFCGSKKSLASGVPMAGVLFPGATLGLVLLPIMLFHQIQLMACAVIAQNYARRGETATDTAAQTV